MIWVQFQRAIFLSKLRLALPNMSLFQNLIFPTLPSTAPDEYGSPPPSGVWQLSGEGTHPLLDLLVQEECTTAQLD